MRKKTKVDLVKAWLLKAHKDLVLARESLKQGENFTDMVCFHAQQCAEKALKAYLVWLDVEFPKTHMLEQLLDLISQKDTSLEPYRSQLHKMTDFAVESRYPEFSLPSSEEAKNAVQLSDEVFAFIKSKLPKECLP
jgi:HEPN domain-containing protein